MSTRWGLTHSDAGAGGPGYRSGRGAPVRRRVLSHFTFYEPMFIPLTFSRPPSRRIPDGYYLAWGFAYIVSRTFENGESEQVFNLFYFIFAVPNQEFGNHNRTKRQPLKGLQETGPV